GTGFGIAADLAGNAYVTGMSGDDFPTTPGAFQPLSQSGTDAFVSKFTPDGSAFVYSTFLGGSGYDARVAIAADVAGNAYVAGETSSAMHFPTLNAFQPVYSGGSHDAFVTKLVPNGSALRYSSYLGGSGQDAAFGIAVDKFGNAYAVGSTI